MPTPAIKDILSYPNATPIEAIQAKIAQVYEYKPYKGDYEPTTVQSIVLEDATGSIRCSVWGHPDLTEHKGQEYVFGSGRKNKGLVLTHGKGQYAGKVELKMSNAGTLQHVAVYNAGRPAEAVSEPAKGSNQAPVGQETRQAAKSPYTPINGAKVGMALNNAVLMLNASGLPYGMREIQEKALDIIRLSNDLESGRIQIDPLAEAEKPKPGSATPDQKAANQVGKDGEPNRNEDVPW